MSSSQSVSSISAAPQSIASFDSSGARSAERKLLSPPKFVTDAQQTLLYFRAVDADSPDSILADVSAKNLVNKIPLDIVETMGQDLRYVKFWCLRARRIDLWCQEFIAQHPRCTVLNLSCGLDTRTERLQPPPSVCWIDVDHPEVIDFRKRVFTSPSGDYRTIATDISDPNPDDSWLTTIPDDRPTLVVAESNMFYLKPEVAKDIFYQVAEHFSRGQIVVDVLGSLCATLINMRLATVQKKTGMKILWPVDDPHTLSKIHPKIKFIDEMRYSDDMPPWFGEFKTKLLKLLPGYRNLGRVILLGFGEEGEQSEARRLDTPLR